MWVRLTTDNLSDKIKHVWVNFKLVTSMSYFEETTYIHCGESEDTVPIRVIESPHEIVAKFPKIN